MKINRDSVLFSIVYATQGLLGLSELAFPLYLNSLGYGVAAIASIIAICHWPWFIKPLWGMISDSFSILKLRRKPYIIICSILSCVGWSLMASGINNFWQIVLAMTTVYVGFSIVDVVCDGLVVQKSTNKTRGFNQSLCWGSRNLAAVLAGVSAGILIENFGYNSVFIVLACLPILTLISAIFVKEKKTVIKTTLQNSIKSFCGIFKKKHFIMIGIFMFIWGLAPGYSTPLIIFLKKTIGFRESFIGILNSTQCMGGVLGCYLYNKYCDKLNIHKVLKYTTLTTAIATLLFLFILNAQCAIIIYFIIGIASYLGFLPIMKLAARTCPKGNEAMVFAFFMSILNISGYFAVFCGGIIYDYLGFNYLIMSSAIGGLAALPFIKYIKE